MFGVEDAGEVFDFVGGELFGDAGGDGVVAVVGGVLASPGVEAPVDDGELIGTPPLRGGARPGGASHQESRTMIPAPTLVGHDVVEGDALGHRSEEIADDAFVVIVGDVEVDGLALCDFADEFDYVRDDFVVAAWETDAFGAGPTEPRCGVAGPFGGEGEAEFFGSGSEDFEFGGLGHDGGFLVVDSAQKVP